MWYNTITVNILKSKKLLLLTLVLLFVTPIVAVTSSTVHDTVTVTPDDWDSDVGVEAGLTLKYTINELVLPEEELEGVVLPDLSGNSLYVKVLAVEEDKTMPVGFMETETGTLIHYAIGIIFANDETFSIGEGFTALDITIPAGAATPSISLSGVPHFNITDSYYPTTPFFLNNDWMEHEVILDLGLGFTVDNLADTFSASFTNDTGTISGTWRKSDGVLTDLIVDDIYLMGMNYSGVTIDLSLASSEMKGIEIEVGDELEFQADIASLDISGSGDLFSLLNQSQIESIEGQVTSMQENTVLKFVITDVEGLFYSAQVFAYDMETQSLMALEQELIFCAFFGNIPITTTPLTPQDLPENPLITEVALAEYVPALTPIVTPDWDIYTGHMILADTIVGVYLDDILDVISGSAMSGLELTDIEGNFEISEKRGYTYFSESMDVDMTVSISETLAPLSVEVSLELNAHMLMDQDMWIGFAENGEMAGMRMQMSANIEVTSDMDTSVSGMPTGAVNINLDVKIVNPNYNPPDPLGGGIIPGFTWLVALPALLGIAAVGLISRKRKQ